MHPLREMRIKQKLSLSALALRAGLNVNTIAYLERNETRAQDITVQKLADALGCTFDDLAFLKTQEIKNPKAA